MVKKRKNEQEIATLAEPIAIEEKASANNLRGALEEINRYEGVVGYITRNTTSASIDLKDPTKIKDYAILSSSAIDASEELSELFDLGSPRSIIVEGRSAKMLSLAIDENRMSIFMDREADGERILKRLRAL